MKDTGIGRNIRLLRIEKGMTVEQLARKLEVTKQYVSLLELGHKEPSMKALRKLGEILC